MAPVICTHSRAHTQTHMHVLRHTHTSHMISVWAYGPWDLGKPCSDVTSTSGTAEAHLHEATRDTPQAHPGSTVAPKLLVTQEHLSSPEDTP